MRKGSKCPFNILSKTSFLFGYRVKKGANNKTVVKIRQRAVRTTMTGYSQSSPLYLTCLARKLQFLIPVVDFAPKPLSNVIRKVTVMITHSECVSVALID